MAVSSEPIVITVAADGTVPNGVLLKEIQRAGTQKLLEVVKDCFWTANCTGKIASNGMANNTATLKCSRCSTKKTFRALIARYRVIMDQRKQGDYTVQFKTVKNEPVVFRFVRNPDDEANLARDTTPITKSAAGAPAEDIEDEIETQYLLEGDAMEVDEIINNKRKRLEEAEDVTFELDLDRDLDEQLSQMTSAQLMHVTKHALRKAQDASRRYDELKESYDELKAKMTTQDERMEAHNDRITQLESLLTGGEPGPSQAPRQLERPPMTPNTPPSFADIVLRGVPEERHAEVLHARLALKTQRRERVLPGVPRTTAEVDALLRFIYVEGIQRMRFRELKGHMKSLGFSLTKIRSISFIGPATEFIVEESYADLFAYQLKSRLEVKILEDFDPAKPVSDNPAIDPKKACAHRLKLIWARDQTPVAIKNLIADYVVEKDLSREFDAVELYTEDTNAAGINAMETNGPLAHETLPAGSGSADAPIRQ